MEVYDTRKNFIENFMLVTHHKYSCLALQDFLKIHLNLTTIRTSFLKLDEQCEL